MFYECHAKYTISAYSKVTLNESNLLTEIPNFTLDNKKGIFYP